MARTSFSSWRRATIAAAAAIVLGGAGAAAALVSGDTSAPAQTAFPVANVARDGLGAPEPARVVNGQTVPATGGGKGLASSGFGYAPDSSLSYGGGCPAALTGVLNGGKVDPSLGGFPMRLLSGDFTVAGLSIRAERTCYDATNPDRVVRSLDTTWLHGPSNLGVFVSQSEQPEPGPNVLTGNYAQFWADGFAFSVGIQFHFSGPDAPSIQEPGRPSPPQTPPNALPVLEAALKQLAPGLDLACFYREQFGDYGDLAAMGIGDPRPAMPGGYDELSKEIVRVTVPAASCNAVKAEGFIQERVNLFFARSSGQSIGINVNGAEGQGAESTGQFNPGYASWSNGKHYFNLNWDPGVVNEAAARKIALALDPGFANVCFVTQREMTDLEFSALGLKAPKAPEGFTNQPDAGRLKLETSGPCKDAVQGGGFIARWLLIGEAGRGVIEAGAWGGPQQPGSTYFPYIEGQSLYWKDVRGYSFYVTGAKGNLSDSREILLAVAESMDANFDESKLLDPPEGIKPMPMPYPADGGTSTGSSEPVPPSAPKR